MDALIDRLRQTSEVVLVSHINPDGDAVGSLLGLTYILEQLGIAVNPVLLHGVPSAFRFLLKPDGSDVATTLPQPSPGALLIVLDASESSRTGDRTTVEAWADAGQLAVIDHHPGGDLTRLTKGLGFQSSNTSSTCELLYHIGAALHVKFTNQVATALLTGIYTDTGGFHHSNTSTATLEIASELMRRGGALRTIVREAGEHRTLGQLRLIGIGMERLSPIAGGRIVTTIVTQEDVARVQADEDDLNGITGPLTDVDGTDLCMVLSEAEPGIMRGSVRSRNKRHTNLSARALAMLMGGGGHTRAAGFRIPGRAVEVSYSNGTTGWQIVPE